MSLQKKILNLLDIYKKKIRESGKFNFPHKGDDKSSSRQSGQVDEHEFWGADGVALHLYGASCEEEEELDYEEGAVRYWYQTGKET